jgi:hypothetical protein
VRTNGAIRRVLKVVGFLETPRNDCIQDSVMACGAVVDRRSIFIFCRNYAAIDSAGSLYYRSSSPRNFYCIYTTSLRWLGDESGYMSRIVDSDVAHQMIATEKHSPRVPSWINDLPGPRYGIMLYIRVSCTPITQSSRTGVKKHNSGILRPQIRGHCKENIYSILLRILRY